VIFPQRDLVVLLDRCHVSYPVPMHHVTSGAAPDVIHDQCRGWLTYEPIRRHSREEPGAMISGVPTSGGDCGDRKVTRVAMLLP
jgi:hypothetical protein